MTVPIGGGIPRVIASGESPNGIAVDGASVYWTNYFDGTVLKVPLGGGSPTTIASRGVGPVAIAVDAASVYWVDSGNENFADGTIMKAPRSITRRTSP